MNLGFAVLLILLIGIIVYPSVLNLSYVGYTPIFN